MPGSPTQGNPAYKHFIDGIVKQLLESLCACVESTSLCPQRTTGVGRGNLLRNHFYEQHVY